MSARTGRGSRVEAFGSQPSSGRPVQAAWGQPANGAVNGAANGHGRPSGSAVEKASMVRSSLKKGFGLELQHGKFTPQGHTVVVASVQPDSPASKSLTVGDTVLSVNGQDTIGSDVTPASVMAIINKCLHVKLLVIRADVPEPRRSDKHDILNNDVYVQRSVPPTPSASNTTSLPGGIDDDASSTRSGTRRDDVIAPVRKSTGTTNRTVPRTRRSQPNRDPARESTPAQRVLPTPADPEKEERARRGQARRGGTALQAAQREQSSARQEREQLKEMQNDIYKELLGEKNETDLTPPQRASLRKSAMLKAKRRMSADADRAAAAKADALKEKVLRQSKATGALWEKPHDAPEAAGSPAAVRKAAAQAQDILAEKRQTLPETVSEENTNGKGSTSSRGPLPPVPSSANRGSIVSPAMSSPTYDVLDNVYENMSKPPPVEPRQPEPRQPEPVASQPPSSRPSQPSIAPATTASLAATKNRGAVPIDDGLKHIDVAMNGRKLGFSVEQDARGHHVIQGIKPNSVLETDTDAADGDLIAEIDGTDVHDADHLDLVARLKAAGKSGRLVMALIPRDEVPSHLARRARGEPLRPDPATQPSTQDAHEEDSGKRGSAGSEHIYEYDTAVAARAAVARGKEADRDQVAEPQPAPVSVAPPAASPPRPAETAAPIRDILLQHDASNDTWGISVKQGIFHGNDSLYVSDVGQPIVLSGESLQKGDKLVRVNGQDLSAANALPLQVLAEALNEPTVMLGVQHAPHELEYLESGTTDVVPLTLKRHPGDPWGFSSMQVDDEDGQGLLVTQVVHGGRADLAGLRAGDRVVAIETPSGSHPTPALEPAHLEALLTPDQVDLSVERDVGGAPTLAPNQLDRYLKTAGLNREVISVCAKRESRATPWGIALQSGMNDATGAPLAAVIGVAAGSPAAAILEIGDEVLAVGNEDVEGVLKAGDLQEQHGKLTQLVGVAECDLRMVVMRNATHIDRGAQLSERSKALVTKATQKPPAFGSQDSLRKISEGESQPASPAQPQQLRSMPPPASTVQSVTAPTTPAESVAAAARAPQSAGAPQHTSPTSALWRRGGAMAAVQAVSRVKTIRRAEEIKSGLVVIERKKKTDSLGFTFGTPKNGPLADAHVVAAVTEGSPADLGGLKKDDVIASVDGRNVESVDHNSLVKAMQKNKKLEIRLQVHRRFGDAVVQVHTVPIHRRNGTYGMSVGTDPFDFHIVSDVQENSDGMGKVFYNDVIVAVNGLSTKNMTHAELKGHFVKSDVCELQVHRVAQDGEGILVEDAPPAKAREGEVSIEITRADTNVRERQVALDLEVRIARVNLTTGFGFTLGTVGTEPEVYQAVAGVTRGGLADGKLQKRDIVRTINNNPVPRDHREMVQLVSGATALKLGILRPLRPEPKQTMVQVSVTRASTSTPFAFTFGAGEVIVPGSGQIIYEKIVQQVWDGAAQNKLFVDDVLHEINGVNVTRMAVNEVSANVIRPALTLNCVVGRVLPEGGQPPLRNVVITRGGLSDSFGFGMGSVEGGKHVITNVGVHTPSDGKLLANDEIVTANGTELVGMSHQQVTVLVKQCLTLNLEIKRKEPGVKDARTTISKVRPGVVVEDREDNIGFEEHELDVTIRKRNPKESFGISIGSTNHGTSLIVGVAPRGPADGLLRADDEIKSIDGTLVKGLPHPRVLDLFKDKQALKLRVLRKHEVAYANRLDEAQANPEEAAHIAQRSSFGTSETANVRVTLRRRSVAESYGFGLGEADADFSPTGKIITHVSNSSPADQNLFPLDTLMRVDGVEVGQLSHAEVVDLIKRGTKVTLDVHRADPLKVQRAKSVSQVAPNLEVRGRQDDVGLNALPSQGNYLDRKVHIKRGPNEPCGFGIATTDGTRGPPAHVVSVVQPGSPADRSMLAVGDVITSLNDEPVGPLPHRDVVAKLGSMESFTLSVRRAQQRAFNKRASITKVAPDLRIAERDDEVVIVDVPSGNRQATTINLVRPTHKTSFGFGLGATEAGVNVITSVNQGGLSDGKLFTADELVKINGTQASELRHDQIIDIAKSSLNLSLVVLRVPGVVGTRRRGSIRKVDPQIGSNLASRHDDLGAGEAGERTTAQQVAVYMARPNTSVGWGCGVGTTAAGNKVVTSIAPSSSADGKLEVADEIVSVNEQSVQPLTHAEMVRLMSTATTLNLVVVRQVLAATGKGFRKRGSIRIAAPDLASQLQARDDNLTGEILIPEGKTEAVEVTVTRPTATSSFGFGLGTTTDGDKVITKISEGGRSVGKLQVGDTVTAINGQPARAMEHDEALRHIVSLTTVNLQVSRVPGREGLRRGGSIRQVDPTAATKVFHRRDSVGRAYKRPDGQEFAVTIARADLQSSFGFGIGTTTENAKLITKVSPGGVSEGKLQANDAVISVNGRPTAAMEHAELLQHITSGTEVTLGIVRPPGGAQQVDAATNAKIFNRRDSIGRNHSGAAGPAVPTEKERLTVVVNRPDLQSSFGFGLGTTTDNSKVITKVSPGGPAEGKLQAGDSVLSINGLAASPMEHPEALRHITAGTEVTMIVERDPATPLNRRGSIRQVDPNQAAKVLQRRDSIGRGAGGPAAAAQKEQLTVVVTRPNKQSSFGFGLGTTVDNSKIITGVSPGGLAEGKLVPGDSVVSINGLAAAPMQHAQALESVTKGTDVTLIVERASNHPFDRKGSIRQVDPAAAAKVLQRRDSIGRGAGAQGRQQLTVTIARPDKQTSFGFGLGTTNDNLKLVTKVSAGGLAEGKLLTSDRILSVNGEAVTPLQHGDVLGLITAGTEVVLVVERDPTTSLSRKGSIKQVDPAQAAKVFQRRDSIGRGGPAASPGAGPAEPTETDVTARLQRPDTKTSWGFGLGTTDSGAKVVTKVNPGSIAADHLVVADTIVSVNGQQVQSLLHTEALALLGGNVVDVTVVVRRNVAAVTQPTFNRRASISTARPSLAQHLTSRDDVVGTVMIPQGPTRLSAVTITRQSLEASFGFGLGTTSAGDKVVTKVSQGGNAEGELFPGDVVASVNSQPVAGLPHNDTLALITKNFTVSLVVRRSATAQSGRTEVDAATSATMVSRRDSIGRPSGAAARGKISTLHLVKSADRGLGFSTQVVDQRLVVTSVAPDGPAGGQLYPSDTILTINGAAVSGPTDAAIEKLQVELLSSIAVGDTAVLAVRR